MDSVAHAFYVCASQLMCLHCAGLAFDERTLILPVPCNFPSVFMRTDAFSILQLVQDMRGLGALILKYYFTVVHSPDAYR